jgi:quercetin dioxygenase-like cupin family protein
MQHWNLLAIEAPGGSRSPSVLLSEDEARAVLIVLDPGQALGEHQVKEHAWIVVVEGALQVEARGDSINAGVGTLVHFEPDQRHAVSTQSGARFLLLLAPWPGPGHFRGQERASAGV